MIRNGQKGSSKTPRLTFARLRVARGRKKKPRHRWVGKKTLSLGTLCGQ